MHRLTSVLLVAVLFSPSCTSTDSVGKPAGHGESMAHPGDLSTVDERLAEYPMQPLLASQRRWLVDVQVALRGARSVIDTLDAWWHTDELGELHDAVEQVERQLEWFAARHLAPRLATSWTPIERDDHPWAHRYDRLVQSGLADRVAGAAQARVALRVVRSVIERGDADHPEIALLVSTSVAWLSRQVDGRA